MIKFFVMMGGTAMVLTAISLGIALIIIKIKRRRAKQKYAELINEKMNILARLQEELTEEEVIKEKDDMTPPLPSEANLPANFFEQNYLEVKP